MKFEIHGKLTPEEAEPLLYLIGHFNTGYHAVDIANGNEVSIGKVYEAEGAVKKLGALVTAPEDRKAWEDALRVLAEMHQQLVALADVAVRFRPAL